MKKPKRQTIYRKQSFKTDKNGYFAHVHAVYNRLDRAYPFSRLGNKDQPLDELVYTILSVKTQEAKYQNTFHRLQELLPNWQLLLSTDTRRVEKAIAYGGLAKTKADTLLKIAQTLHFQYGQVSLDFLRTLPTHEAEKSLNALPGVGCKIAKCVLMYSLGREVFPVDTHCFRIAKRLGWIAPLILLTNQLSLDMEQSVPPHIRAPLHIRFVQHGKAVCKPVHMQCNNCCIASFCDSFHYSQKRKPEAKKPSLLTARFRDLRTRFTSF